MLNRYVLSHYDTLGHLAGDEVLKCIAKILKSNIAISRRDFVTRFGGDEFLIVCRNISPADFEKRIAAVTLLIRHITLPDGTPIDVGISTGCVSLCEFLGSTAQGLIEFADKRLYQAKAERSKKIPASD